VDELLNVSRIQSGSTVFRLEPVDVEKLIRSVIGMQSHITDRHRFAVRAKNGLPKVNAEHDKLRQVLENLLSNAVKYSPQGGTIIIDAEYRPGEQRVVISVTDEGIGIDEEDQLYLFTTFHRIHRAETQGIPGSGLGLYIVKRWVEAMGGSVWLESEIDKGSTFYVSIPTAENSFS
jgi:signal transduction histidine kinase